MSFFKKTCVGVEFHDQLIQIVELSKHENIIELEALNRIPISDGLIENGEIKNKAALQTKLVEAFDTANPQQIPHKNISVILPTRVVFSHIFKLPLKLSEKDVYQAISYEAENIVPFTLADLYWDYRILEKEDAKQKHASQYVLFTAVPKTIAESYADLFESMKIHVESFGVSIDAVLQILEPYIKEKGENAVLSFGPFSTQTFLLEGNKLRQFFSSNDGYEKFIRNMQTEHQWTEEEFRKKWQHNTLEKEQLNELSAFVRAHYIKARDIMSAEKYTDLKELFITGEYASLPLFYDLAVEIFPNLKVTIGDPKVNLIVQDKKFLAKHMQTGEETLLSIYFTNVIGLALSELRKNLFSPVNLLPTHLKSIIRLKKLEAFGTVWSVGLTLLSLIISGSLFIKHQDYYFERAELETQKQSIENTLYGTRYQDIKTLFGNFNNELTALTKIEAGLFSLSDFIRDIYSVIPDEVSVTSFAFDDINLVMELTGVAPTREKLLELQKILEEQESIKTVTLPLSNFDKKQEISFAITLELNFSKLPKYGNGQ